MKSDKLSGYAEIESSRAMGRQRNSRGPLVSKDRSVRSKIVRSSQYYKAVTNEINHPYVVEVAVVSDGLDIDLCRRIMQFHTLRHVEPRCGRRVTYRRGKMHYGWCFSDLLIARAFAEQFGGEFRKSST
jgi:hypothetical protein